MSNKTQPQQKRGLTPNLRFPEFREAGAWERKRLGQIAKSLDNKRIPITASNRVKGKIPYYGASGIVDYINDFLFDEDLLCISEDGNNLIARAYPIAFSISGKSWVNNHAHVLRFKNRFTQTIVESYLNSIRLDDFLTGMAQPKLNRAKLDNIPMPLPPKLEEQQKIADCLTSLDDLIAAHSQKLNALRAHKKGLLQQLFPAPGETVPRLRFPEFRASGAWVNTSLGETSTITSGGTPSRSKTEFWNGNIPWVTTTLIDFNTIYHTNEYISEIGLKRSSAKLFPKNTILMAMYGQGKTRGKVAILGIEATTNQACAAILLNTKLHTNFVFQNLASRYDEIRDLSNRGGQANLSAGLIETIPFSYPIDKNEQQKIAACLSSLDEQIAAQSQKIDALKAHKKGLLQQLFPSPEKAQP